MITKIIFQSFLKCEMKAYLTCSKTVEEQCDFADCYKRLTERYKKKSVASLISKCSQNEYKIGASFPKDFNDKHLRFLIDCEAHGREFTSHIHAIERLLSPEKKNTKNYIPIDFVSSEKITRHDKLMLSFDALVLFSASGDFPLFGKIIHGSQLRTVKIKLDGLINETRKIFKKITALQAINEPPKLILNKHCAECRFRFYCRTKAVEKDELTLLSGMSEKERRQYNSKGMFTVTQLSHTFRPRKKSKRVKSKTTKYYHSLKALAIRENKIYIVGKPKLVMTGTPVYLDVEGIPDQDFYYLIGLRVKKSDSFFQHSFWANDKSEEKQMWRGCLQVLTSIDNPQIMHYGSYEAKFLKRIKDRYADSIKETKIIDHLIAGAQNLLDVIYAQIYFPTYSNSLKDIGRFLGFAWSEKDASGQRSLLWRYEWAVTNNTKLKEKLIRYNAEDCEAAERFANAILQLIPREDNLVKTLDNIDVVHTDTLKSEHFYNKWGKTEFFLPELNYINKCAYWDYQRDKIYLRSNPILERVEERKSGTCDTSLQTDKIVKVSRPWKCPKCDSRKIQINGRHSKPLHDLKFIRGGVKRWIVKYLINHYKCRNCGNTFAPNKHGDTRHLYGLGLLAYVIYNNIELNIPELTIAQSVNKLFGYHLGQPIIYGLKKRASELYLETYEAIRQKLMKGKLIHADETKASIRGQTGYVWVFTSLEEVIYVWAETREVEILKTFLNGFKGVLVSDFYGAYDSIDCPQQKCLIHLIRDLNGDMLKDPFNEEMKLLVHDFTALLKPIIETIDRFGLKKYFLEKHKSEVQRFYKNLLEHDYKTEIALKYQKRFQKNQNKLFTFLDHDGVTWNNNNAEHAIRAFARLRKIIRGMTNERGIRVSLILLSICVTCKRKGISFLDFLRSGKKHIDEYIDGNR
jgi:predicted RecB family nuclease